ncbi:MAG: hypothetical protein NVS3B2_01440 [Ramlibacter sp.]
MSILDKTLLTLAFVCAAMRPAWCADAPTVGMVLDLQGPATLTENGQSGKLQLLARLTEDARIELQEGARASVTLYATRSVYRLTGPAVVNVQKGAVVVVKGAAPEVKVMGQKAVTASAAGTFVAGAYRMRGMNIPPAVLLTSPENGSVLLESRPLFSWEATDATSFLVALQGESGEPLYSATVNGVQWVLPPGVQLEPGHSYQWSVTSVAQPDGQNRTVTGKFSVATKAEAEQFSALKPAEADPIEDWVYYAVLLQQRQMRSEARNVWKRIANRRPDLIRAAELARSP